MKIRNPKPDCRTGSSEIRNSPADWTATTPAELLAAHLFRQPNTARAYAADIETFRSFMADGRESRLTRSGAVRRLCELQRGAAERTIHRYLVWLRGRYEPVNTIRRKVASVMGLLKLAHRFGVIPWAADPVKLPAPEPVRDTRGPGRREVLAMLESCRARGGYYGARDEALVYLLAFGAYRCNEALSLDVRHLDLDGRTVEVAAKGRIGRVRHPIPREAAESMARWMELRGDEPGPVFVTGECEGGLRRMSYWRAYAIIRRLGRSAGIVCSPHKLRHFAATSILSQTNGNIVMAMALTRHRDPRTLMVYNDERATRAREAMELLISGRPCFRPNELTTDK